MRWIVFDFGEVISQRNPALPFIAERLGVSLEHFEAAYWDRDAYDRGGSDADYWSLIGSSLGLSFDDDAVRELTALDNAGWLDDPVAETATFARLGRTDLLQLPGVDAQGVGQGAHDFEHIGEFFRRLRVVRGQELGDLLAEFVAQPGAVLVRARGVDDGL